MSNDQIKSRKRVKERGEVFTAPREVNAILDLVKDEIANATNSTVLEPACGTGNFIIEIVRRKLASITEWKDATDLCVQVSRALSFIYGIDIMPDNVAETRKRIAEFVEPWFNERCDDERTRRWMQANLNIIIGNNIVCGDTLAMKDATGADLTFLKWEATRSGEKPVLMFSPCRFKDNFTTPSGGARHDENPEGNQNGSVHGRS